MNTNQQPAGYMKDPAMEAARMEIIGVLKKHDLMGSVIFCGKERAGFFSELSPSWSCASIVENTSGIEVRVRAKREDFASEQEQAQVLASTINGLCGLQHNHGYIGELLTGMIQLIGQKVDFTSMCSDGNVQVATAVADPGVAEFALLLRVVVELLGMKDGFTPEIDLVDLFGLAARKGLFPVFVKSSPHSARDHERNFELFERKVAHRYAGMVVELSPGGQRVRMMRMDRALGKWPRFRVELVASAKG